LGHSRPSALHDHGAQGWWGGLCDRAGLTLAVNFLPGIRPETPLSLEDAQRLVEGYVEHYNHVRLNSAIGYITPKDMLAGRQQEIHADRDRKLEAARQLRQIRRQQAA